MVGGAGRDVFGQNFPGGDGPFDVPDCDSQRFVFSGGKGADRSIGTRAVDVVFGGRGNDRLRGKKGADRIFGGPGRDRLLGGSGQDVLIGGAGRGDTAYGGGAKDLCRAERVGNCER